MSGHLGRQAVVAVDAAFDQAPYERLGDRAAAVELNLSFGIFAKEIFLDRLNRALVVRKELALKHI